MPREIRGPDRFEHDLVDVGVEVEREVGLECTLPDGTVLVADAWHPAPGTGAGDGPWPVLLQRLPYGRSVASSPVLPHPSWLAAHGYLVVVQDVRGRGDSGGRFAPFVHAGADGAAAIEWAAGLPRSNGDVATYGFSYQGLLQLYAAAERPPSLRAIAPMMCAPDPFEGWTYEGGALRWPFVCFWAGQLAGQEVGGAPVAFDVGALPPTTALGADPPPWFTEWLAYPDGDDAYWAVRRPDLGAIEVPAFVVAGWFDDFSAGSLRVAEALRAELHVGPWAHMPWGTRAGGVELGPAASPAPIAPALVAFFDRVLKGEGDPPERPVRIHTHGRGWESVDSWPGPGSILTLHAHSGGMANSRHGDGTLGPDPPAAPLADVLVVEPLVPHPGDDEPLSDEGPAEDRRDVVCYTSDPLPGDTVLRGAPVALVTSRSDRPSHDVVVSLVLVAGEHRPTRLVTGVHRLAPGEPGTPRSVEVELRPISWLLPAGARIRVDVSGARFPSFDRNPHTGTVPPTDVAAPDTRVATVEIRSVEIRLPTA